MRDVVAAFIAIVLLLFAASLATGLTVYRRRRERQRRQIAALGQTVIAEIPADDGLTLFTEDRGSFYYGDLALPKPKVRAARVLVNGAPIAAVVSRRFPAAGATVPVVLEDHPEGIVRDRWDVSLDTEEGEVLVACGAIRERVSQELARKIFDAVKTAIESRDAGSSA